MERSGRGLTAGLFRHLHRGSEEDDEVSLSKRLSPDYKCRTLPLHQPGL